MIKGELKNYGFVKPIFENKNFILGGVFSLPKIVLNQTGQWDDFLPTYEPQTLPDGEDEDGCAVWGTENCIETILKQIENKEYNFSERYIYNLANVLPPGSDPQTIAETIRSYGLISQELLPMTNTLAEFEKPRPMSPDLIAEGAKFPYDFGHEYVWSQSQTRQQRIDKVKECLRYSPLGASVTAWFSDENGIYVDNGLPNCHWIEIYGMDDEKQAFKVFDSYDQSHKLYSYDSEISICKRYALSPRTVDKNTNWVADIFKSLYNFIKDILTIKNHATN